MISDYGTKYYTKVLNMEEQQYRLNIKKKGFNDLSNKFPDEIRDWINEPLAGESYPDWQHSGSNRLIVFNEDGESRSDNLAYTATTALQAGDYTFNYTVTNQADSTTIYWFIEFYNIDNELVYSTEDDALTSYSIGTNSEVTDTININLSADTQIYKVVFFRLFNTESLSALVKNLDLYLLETELQEAEEIKYYPVDPISLVYRSSSKNDDLQIHGSELNFNFYVTEQDGDKYNELFESEYQQWLYQLDKIKSDVQEFSSTGSGSDWNNQPGSTQIYSSRITGVGGTYKTKEVLFNVNVNANETIETTIDCYFTNTLINSTAETVEIGLMDNAYNKTYTTTFTPSEDVTSATTLNLTASSASTYIYVSFSFTSSHISGVRFNINSLTRNEPYWYGYLNPENLTRKLLVNQYFISSSATDALAELKNIDYPISSIVTYGTIDNPSQFNNPPIVVNSGTTSGMQIIKNCLDQTGLNLPVWIQLNYQHDTITTTGTSFFENTFFNQNRFIKNNKDGRITYESCYEALSKLLKSFHCRLSQVNSRWEIIQKLETDSPVIKYASYNDITGDTYTSTLRNRELDISTYKSAFDSDELSKVRPYNVLALKFFNKNAGESLLNSNEDWTNFGYDEIEYYDNGMIRTEIIGTELFDDFVLKSSDFYVDTLDTTGTTLSVSFDFNLANFSGGKAYKSLVVRLYDSDDNLIQTIGPENENSVTDKRIFKWEDEFSVSETGYYNLAITIRTVPNSFENATIFWSNIFVLQGYKNATYDKYYEGKSNIKYTNTTLEDSIYFSDGIQSNDVGNIKWNLNTGHTTTWSNYSGSIVDQSHQHLYAYEKLKLFRKFRDYIRITLKSDTDINFNSILTFQGKKYMITGYSYYLQTMSLSLELVELLEDDFDFSFAKILDLNSVDGETIS